MPENINSVGKVQEALVRAADKLQPAPLKDVIEKAERLIGIGVNETWATEALESRGFTVERVGLAGHKVVFRPKDPPTEQP